MTEVYSKQKALWHWPQLAALTSGEQPYPVHVQLIVCDHCNRQPLPAETR